MSTDADLCAHAFLAMLRLLVHEMPGMYEQPGAPGVAGIVSGMPLATLNGVFTEVTQPSITDVSAAAAGMARLGAPWCIQFRGEPDPEAGQLGRKYGLTERDVVPLMRHRAVPGQPVRPASESAASRVRVVGLEDRSGFAAALAAGFEAPLEVMAPFTIPEFFAIPAAVPYAAEEDGKIVAVGLGIFLEECAGIFNIATVPAYRGRGYGRAVTRRIVTDGIERGAPVAFLQSSAAGYPLYQSMGFRTVEQWTYLLPAG